MFGTFRRHQKWIWIGAIIVVIPSFVIFFSPDIGTGTGQPKVIFGVIDGKEVSRAEYTQAHREVGLRYRLFTGRWPDDAQLARFGSNMDQETLTRVALVRRLKTLGVKVGDDAVAEQVRNYFRDQQGQYDPASYREYLAGLARESQVTEAEFVTFVRNQVGVQHLTDTFGISGRLVPPRAAEDAYRHENEQLLTQGVFFYVSNQMDKVQIKTNELAQFYTNRLGLYRIPVRVQVQYVAFEAINYLNEAAKQMAQNTNLTALIDQEYQRRGTNSFLGDDAKVLAPEAAKEKIKDEIRKQVALTVARREANNVATVLFDIEKRTMKDFLTVAATNKLEVKVSEPFTISDGPKDLKVPPDFARSAFALTAEEPVSVRPAIGEDAVYLFALKERLKPEDPPMESILARVTEDYRNDQAVNLMKKAAQEFHAALLADGAKGKTFADVAKATGLTAHTFAPIRRSAREAEDVEKHVSFFSYQNQAWDTPVGKFSEPVYAGDVGFVLQVTARQPAPADKMAEELPALLTTLRDNAQGAAANEWYSRQAQGIQVPVSDSK